MAYKILLFLFSFNLFAASVAVSPHKIFPYAHAPINLIKNPSCEKNDSNITDADSIVSANDTTPLVQGGDCAIDADASAEFAEWAVEDFSAVAGWLKGQNCEASMYYEGDASDYDFEVYIGSTEINSESLLDSGSSVNQISLNFPCGDLTTDPTIRITATDNVAAAINVAKLYIGPATNIGSVAQANQFLFASLAVAQSIPDVTETDIVWDTIDDSSGLISYSTSTGIITFNRGGKYTLTASPTLGNVSDTTQVRVRGYHNASIRIDAISNASATNNDPTVIAPMTIEVASGDTAKFTIEHTSGTSESILAARSFLNIIQEQVSESEQVFKVGFAGQEFTSYTPELTGTTSGTFSNSTTTGFYQCDSGVLKVTARSTFSGIPSVASGNLAWSIPSGFTIDTAKLNSSTSYQQILGIAQAIDGLLRYQGTPAYFSDTKVAVLTDGGTGTAWSATAPFAFNSGDSASVNFEVPVTADSPCPRTSMPLLKNAVTTSYDGVMRTEVGEIDCDATPAVIGQLGSWLGTPTQTATGRCTAVINTGIFSAPPYCTFTGQSTGATDLSVYEDTNITRTSTAFGFRITVAGADSNGDVIIKCTGPN